MNENTSPTIIPAHRQSHQEIQRQASYFSNPLYQKILDAIPQILIILNEQRQIVFANKSLQEYPQLSIKNQTLGQRPGEVLRCVHADETEDGCGTTEFCKTCGAVNAIMESLCGKYSVQECRIMTQETGESLDFRVWTTPLQIHGERFSIFYIMDIQHEKRRHALERIFFHDVLNTAGALLGFTNLLQQSPPQQIETYCERIYRLSNKIIDEIKSQRDLSKAENNELTLQIYPILSIDALQEIIELYQNHEAMKGQSIKLDASSHQVLLKTDPQLLRRVLGNMLKNALEASSKGDQITLGCYQQGNHVVFWIQNPQVISHENQLQIFQRSFSTKGEGRGLGTYSIKLLTERYLQGKVWFISNPEQKTIFYAQCPLSLHS